ncbi:hypothetical protein Tco_0032858 [Tanacetum coccineum]
MFIEQSHDEVYGYLKGGSGNSEGKRLAISMVKKAWLSEKKEVSIRITVHVSLGARWSTHLLVSGVEEGSISVAEAFVPVVGDGVARFVPGIREVVGESVPEFSKDRLMFLLGREIVEDIRKALGDCGDGNESLGLLERLQLECMEKGVRLRLMMKETQLKIVSRRHLMAELPRYDELRRAASSPEWENMFVLYCRRVVIEDERLAWDINGLCAGLTARIEEIGHFINELDVLVDEYVPEKMAKFLKQTQDKDIDKLMKLQILGREFELRVVEKKRFYQDIEWK